MSIANLVANDLANGVSHVYRLYMVEKNCLCFKEDIWGKTGYVVTLPTHASRVLAHARSVLDMHGLYSVLGVELAPWALIRPGSRKPSNLPNLPEDL